MPNDRISRRKFIETTSKIAGMSLMGGSAVLLAPSAAQAQTDGSQVATALRQQIQTPDVVEFQLRQYLMGRVPPLPTPATAEDWDRQQKQLRNKILKEIIFYGWPQEWVDAPLKVEDAGNIPSGKGYRSRKLRYEIVPGFWSTAILYEPEKFNGKVPATLNLNGHAPNGKAAEYKQKRCIDYALQGMVALSLEWLGMGELAIPENAHWMGAHLNLVGACSSGIFYLAMRKGLDLLAQHPNVDVHRMGVTGLSGGAWQTITLSSLDERVAVAIPISGYFSFISGIESEQLIGDIEYNPPDMRMFCDYAGLTAMRAPRPTLIIYGAEDEWGIRSPLLKPHLYDDIVPYYKLYGKEQDFVWHENIDPGTHNYQLDNRQQSYAFFTKHFNMPIVEKEIPVDSEIKSYEELAVGLPKDNLNILSLAKKLAAEIKRPPVPAEAESRRKWAASARTKLKNVVRYKPVNVKHAWMIASSRNRGLETLSYRLEFSDELSATAVWMKAYTAPANAPISIVIGDEGMQTHTEAFSGAVSDRVNRGEQVLAVNLLFTGDAAPDKDNVKSLWGPTTLYTELLASIGERPLGMEAAQLIGATKWMQETKKSQRVFLKSMGIRSHATALVASSLEPELYAQVEVKDGLKSLQELLDKPVAYLEAPDLFCLDLYKEFDIDSLTILAEPTRIA